MKKEHSNKLKKDYKQFIKEFDYGDKAFEGVPKHVAIICDGNRRYAKANGLNYEEVYTQSVENIAELLARAGQLGVEVFTVWVMDTKNFQRRSAGEIKTLLKLFLKFGMEFKQEFLDQKIKYRHIGARNFLPKRVQKLIIELEEETKDNDKAVFNMAFNYGGRDEIIRAVKEMIVEGVAPEEVTEEMFGEYLDTSDIGDPDMIIRTGNEIRLSGFMSWQSAGSELFFVEELFPEFGPDELEREIRKFPDRSRRMGK